MLHRPMAVVAWQHESTDHSMHSCLCLCCSSCVNLQQSKGSAKLNFSSLTFIAIGVDNGRQQTVYVHTPIHTHTLKEAPSLVNY